MDHYLARTNASNKNLVNVVTADTKAAGLSFVPYEDNMTGGTKVSLVVKPRVDYHWYVYVEKKSICYSEEVRIDIIEYTVT